MNRYPLWLNVVIAVGGIGFLFALPNFYGESPAVQVSSKATLKIDDAALKREEMRSSARPFLTRRHFSILLG
jgi:preprotein translocase subunit SecD